jgi:hypothetical protein
MDARDYMAAKRAKLLAAEALDLSNNATSPKYGAPRHRPRMLAGMTKASRLSTAYTNTIQKVAVDCGPIVEKPTPCCIEPDPSPKSYVPLSSEHMHREMQCDYIYRERMARPSCHKGDDGLFVTRTDVRDSNNPRSHNAGVHTVAIREIIEEQRPSYADALLPVVPPTPVPCPPSLTDGYYEPSLQSGRIGPCAPGRPSLN